MNDAKTELFWAILMLVGLGVVWYYTGGPSRPAATSGPFLQEPMQKQQSELRETTERTSRSENPTRTEVVEEPNNESPYKYQATLRVGFGAKTADPTKEYLEIIMSPNNKEPVNVSGWTLESPQSMKLKLGEASKLPRSLTANPQKDALVRPGDTIMVSTGKSPIGSNFQINKCTGYFEQFKDFIPRLPEQCPYPEEDMPTSLSNNCYDYVKQLPRCEQRTQALPPSVSSYCQTYIMEKLNYKSCVQLHKNDSDFYKPKWRFYLGKNSELWKDRGDTIILRDGNSKVIDQVSY